MLIIKSLAEAAQGLSCTFSSWHAIYVLWSPFYQNRQVEGGKYIRSEFFSSIGCQQAKHLLH